MHLVRSLGRTTPGVLFGSTPFGLLRINADGSGSTLLGNQTIEGLGYDSATNTLYGALNTSFFTLNQATGAIATTLASSPVDVDGLDFGNGLVYGLSDINGNLYSYKPGTSSWSLVGNTGISWNNPGLAYDPVESVLYAIGDTSTANNLYRINPATAAVAIVGPTGLSNDGGGLAFVPTGVAVPEPSSLVLFSLAISGILGYRWRRGPLVA